jgi:hypothetical protein
MMTPREWIEECDAPDQSLAYAYFQYAFAEEPEHREFWLLVVVRAERRLAARYAPAWVARRLSGHHAGLGPDPEEAEDFYQAYLRGE